MHLPAILKDLSRPLYFIQTSLGCPCPRLGGRILQKIRGLSWVFRDFLLENHIVAASLTVNGERPRIHKTPHK